MTDEDQQTLTELAARLGMVAGALSRPEIAAALVQLLGQPDARAFSLPAVMRLHGTLGRVIEAIKPPDERYALDVRDMGQARRLVTQLRARNAALLGLHDAVRDLIKAKGRFHTEQNYAALALAFDAAEKQKGSTDE